MKFNDLLKYFLKNTNSKSGALAEYVGYDISYISKWTSGVKIPSENHSEEILCNISQFFTETIFKNRLYHIVQNISPKRLKLNDRSSIYFVIHRFFSDAYNFSLYIHEDYKVDGRAKNITIEGSKNISKFTMEAILKHISASEKDITIYSTLDIPKLFDIGTVNNMNIFVTKDICVKFNTAVSLDRTEKFDKNYSIIALLLMFKASDIDMNLYNSDEFKELQVILLENKFVILYNYLPDGAKIAFYTEDANIISVVQANVFKMFDRAEKITESSNKSIFELDEIRPSFFNSDSFLISPSFLNGLAFTEKNLEYLKNTYNFSNKKMEYIKTISNFSNFLKPSQKVEFVIAMSKIADIVEERKINILDTYIVLDYENMIDYLKNIANILESNPNLTVYTLKNDLPINKEDLTTSFILSDNVTFLKKDIYYKNKNVPIYYCYRKDSLSKLIKNNLLKIAKTSPFFEKDTEFIISYIRKVLIPKLKYELKNSSY